MYYSSLSLSFPPPSATFPFPLPFSFSPSPFFLLSSFWNGLKYLQHSWLCIFIRSTIPHQNNIFDRCNIFLGVKPYWPFLGHLFLFIQLIRTNIEEPCSTNLTIISHHRKEFLKERQTLWYRHCKIWPHSAIINHLTDRIVDSKLIEHWR